MLLDVGKWVIIAINSQLHCYIKATILLLIPVWYGCFLGEGNNNNVGNLNGTYNF